MKYKTNIIATSTCKIILKTKENLEVAEQTEGT